MGSDHACRQALHIENGHELGGWGAREMERVDGDDKGVVRKIKEMMAFMEIDMTTATTPPFTHTHTHTPPKWHEKTHPDQDHLL